MSLLHRIQVDDCRAVDPNEAPRIKLRFQRMHLLADEVRLPDQMQSRVVALRLDPLHLPRVEEYMFPVGFHDQAVAMRRLVGCACDQLQQSFISLMLFFPVTDELLCSLYCLLEAGAVKRL